LSEMMLSKDGSMVSKYSFLALRAPPGVAYVMNPEFFS